jgi:alpha-mannosidase
MPNVPAATPPAANSLVSQLGYARHCSYIPEERSAEGMENSLLRVELNPVTGGIRRLIDKRSGLAIIDDENAGPQLEYLIERHHPMSAWVIFDGQNDTTPRLVSLKRTQAGPYKAGIELQYQIAESEMTLTLELRADDPQLYISIAGTWFQRGSAAGFPMLRLALPLSLEDAHARYEIAFGAIDRTINNGQELPALQWAQVNGKIGTKKAGCLLSNDCKYGHSLDGNIFRLTLIRSSIEPDPLPEIGRHEVALALRPFAGELPVADAVRTGNALNHPLRVIGTDLHAGSLPAEASFISIEPGNVILLGMKKAQNEDALILRICEVEGRAAAATISLDSKLLGKPVSVVETDLMERPLKDSAAKIAGSSIRVAVPSRGINTVMVKLSHP